MYIQSKSANETLERARLDLDKAKRDGDLVKASELLYGTIPDLEARVHENNHTGALLQESVTREHIAEVVSAMVGVSVSTMLSGEAEGLLNMEQELGARVVGQDHVLEALSDCVRQSSAGLRPHTRPQGVFLMCGTTGVGKTETAKALTEYLYGDVSKMVRVDMSEYKEAHTVSRLIGAPPGYIGHDQPGQLTEAVRRMGSGVVLLDEIGKC